VTNSTKLFSFHINKMSSSDSSSHRHCPVRPDSEGNFPEPGADLSLHGLPEALAELSIHREPMEVDPPAPEPMEVDPVPDRSTVSGSVRKRKWPFGPKPKPQPQPKVKKEER
jgi:hypothetical protein